MLNNFINYLYLPEIRETFIKKNETKGPHPQQFGGEQLSDFDIHFVIHIYKFN